MFKLGLLYKSQIQPMHRKIRLGRESYERLPFEESLTCSGVTYKSRVFGDIDIRSPRTRFRSAALKVELIVSVTILKDLEDERFMNIPFVIH